MSMNGAKTILTLQKRIYLIKSQNNVIPHLGRLKEVTLMPFVVGGMKSYRKNEFSSRKRITTDNSKFNNNLDKNDLKEVTTSPIVNEIDQIYLTTLSQQNIMKDIKQSEKEYPILHGDKFDQLFDLQADTLSKIEKLSKEMMSQQQEMKDGMENTKRTFVDEEIEKLKRELDRTVSRISHESLRKNSERKMSENWSLQSVRPFYEIIGSLHELRAKLNHTTPPIPEKTLNFVTNRLIKTVGSIEKRLEKIIFHHRNNFSEDYLKHAKEELKVQRSLLVTERLRLGTSLILTMFASFFAVQYYQDNKKNNPKSEKEMQC
ncbi:896_t:CDS:2 [Acaulospora morrowiae]|uniref:896_t:CDS:1 n=1 Tax=Acaulospora morrowiae TaxID=94023 RepID=A0A9N8VBD2_9GLOM|nr:896_t:CDS:2 [Acaulospora morrowiae]